ncbi:MAG: GFA family protein [Kangiellaceae bacterium]|nr:GFA family protein [Kangiellaceae bacterium]
MSKLIKGKCLCGDVKYEIENRFEQFYICHCEQCRKITGSAYASNLFGDPRRFNVICGLEKIKRFDHDVRGFTKAFCIVCGSGVPYLNTKGDSIVVPAGTLDGEPNFTQKNIIFHKEKANWSEQNEIDRYFDGFPF